MDENRKQGLPRIDSLREAPAAVRFLLVDPFSNHGAASRNQNTAVKPQVAPKFATAKSLPPFAGGLRGGGGPSRLPLDSFPSSAWERSPLKLLLRVLAASASRTYYGLTLTFSAVRKLMGNEIPIDYKLTIDGDTLKGKGASEFGGQKQEFDIVGKREKKDK